MSRPRLAILSVLPLGLLAACAGMPMDAPAPPAMRRGPASCRLRASLHPTRRGRSSSPSSARRRAALEGTGALTRARQHWRYVLAMAPDDTEARQQIARLETVIRTRRDAALAQGEAAMMRGQTAQAQTAFLRVLALDGANAQARRRLLELETRAAFARQDRKDARARMARTPRASKPRTTSARRGYISAAAGSASARWLARGSAARSCGWDRRQALGPTQRWRHPDPGAETPRRHRGNSRR